MNSTEQQVLAAADVLIDAFARHDRDAYFAAFAPEASFVFHHVDTLLRSREAYERRWRELWGSTQSGTTKESAKNGFSPIPSWV